MTQKIRTATFILILLTPLAHICAADEDVILMDRLELSPDTRIDYLRVRGPLKEGRDNNDAVIRSEIRLIQQNSNIEILYQGPGAYISRKVPLKGVSPSMKLKDAKVSKDRAEILVRSGLMFDNGDLYRFAKNSDKWVFLGRASIYETSTSGKPSKAEILRDWGLIEITRQTGDVEVYTIDKDGVVRLKGEVFIPEKVPLAGSASLSPEDCYRTMYNSSRVEYETRDENGVEIFPLPTSDVQRKKALKTGHSPTPPKFADPAPRQMDANKGPSPGDSASSQSSPKILWIGGTALAVVVVLAFTRKLWIHR